MCSFPEMCIQSWRILLDVFFSYLPQNSSGSLIQILNLPWNKYNNANHSNVVYFSKIQLP